MSARIVVQSNVVSQFFGSSAEEKVFDEGLSFFVKGHEKTLRFRNGLWDGRKRFFSRVTKRFPTGLVDRGRRFVPGVEVVDRREAVEPPIPGPEAISADMLVGLVGRDYQVSAARAVLQHRRGVVALATNSGKTWIAAAITKACGSHTVLYVVHKRVLLRQAREDLCSLLGVIPEHVGVIGDGQFSQKRVTVATVQSLYKIAKVDRKFREWLRVRKVLILDEVHHAKGKLYYGVACRCDAAVRVGLSGTPFPDEESRLCVEAVTGPLLARTTNNQLEKRGVSATATVRIVSYSAPEIDDEWDFRKIYREGVVQNEARNAAAVRVVEDRVSRGLATLVLVAHVWHGEVLSSMLRVLGVKHVFLHAGSGSFAIDEALVKFKAGELLGLIASPIFDEGVSVPAIRCLVVVDGMKSLRSVLQKAGRALRKKEGENTVEIVDFADSQHPVLARHAQRRIAIYESQRFKLVV